MTRPIAAVSLMPIRPRERALMPPEWRQSARRRAVAWPGKPARALAAQPGLVPRVVRRFMAVPGALPLRLRLTEEFFMAAGVKALTAVAGVRISRWAARMAAGVKALTAVAGVRTSRWAARVAAGVKALTAVAGVRTSRWAARVAAGVKALTAVAGVRISRRAARVAAGVKALTAVAGVRISRWAARVAAEVKALTAVAEVEALTAVADPTPAGAAIMIELAGCRGTRYPVG
jgi:hypothetical protein